MTFFFNKLILFLQLHFFKLHKKKRTEDLMEMLGLKETVVQMAKASEMVRTGMC